MHRRRNVSVALVLAAAAAVVVLGRGDLSQSASAAAATPPVTAGLQLWFEADTETTADGAAVTTWTDKSGFGRNLTAAAGGEPIMRRNAVNGRAAIEFNGTTSLLKTYNSTFTIAQPDTFFIVYRAADPNNGTRAFVFDSTNSNVRQVLGRPSLGAERMYANIDMDSPGVTYPFAGYDLWSGTFNGTSSTMYRDGSLMLTGNAGGSSLSGFTVGGLSAGSIYGYDMSHSYVAEILVYAGSMTSAQMASMTDWLNQKYAFNAPPAPPANTALPSVTGLPADGATVNAANGTWSGTTPMTFTYQWQLCNSTGAACANLAGATSGSYTPVSSQVGSTLKVIVTATNSAGSAAATSAASAVISAGPPVNQSLPTISGSATQGQTLTASTGTWGGTGPFTYTYEWRRCDGNGSNCTAVGTGPSYALQSGDVGSTMRVAVTASNTAGSATAASTQTSVVTPPVGSSNPPPVTSGLQLWYDANQEAYADGAAVTKWTDRSGFGRDLTSFDAGSAATFRRNAVNGLPAIEFNGSTSLLKTYGSTFTIAQPDTFFIVYRSLDTGASNIFDSMNSSLRQSFGRTGTNEDMYADVDLTAADTFPMPGYELWSGIFNGNTSSLSKNGGVAASGRAGSASLSGFTLGGLNSSGQYGYSFSHSLVAEVLWYSGALTSAQQSQIVSWLNGKYAFLAPPSPPASSAPPSITGSLLDGATVSATNGTWTGTSPFTFTYQWQRCNSTGGACANIAGATNQTYTIVSGDVGSTLKVSVTAANSVGNATATSAASAVIAAGPPVNATPPAVSGSAAQGQTLTATNGTWNGTAPITFSTTWQRCDSSGNNCANIATGTSYVLTATDVGSTMRASVTATNAAGSVSAASPPTAVVTPQITGDAPPVTAGLQMWFDANQEAYADGAAVTKWTDRSGFGRDLTSFDAGSAATFRRNAVNGRPAIEFNGSTSLLKTYGSTFTIAQPDTFFIVYKQLDPGEAYIFDSTNSLVRQLLGRGPNTDIEMYADVDLIVPSYTFPFANYELWSGTYNGNTSTLSKNGTQIAAGPAGSTSLNGFTVGALSTSAQYGYLYSHSLVAEILWYSGNLSTADRNAVTTWLKGRYAIP
jgi:hypothetical protein